MSIYTLIYGIFGFYGVVKLVLNKQAKDEQKMLDDMKL